MNLLWTLWSGLALAAPVGGLVAEPATIDAGTVRAGSRLVKRFTLSNRGPTEWTITAAEASCGCLSPRLTQRTVPPGSSTELELEVNTLSQPEGPNRWRVTVRYQARAVGTSPAGPVAGGTLELALTARLIREVNVEPATLALIAGHGLTHTLTVTDRRERPFAVTAVRTTSPHLTARLAGSPVKAGPEWQQRVELTVADDCPPGRLDAALLVLSADPLYPELKVSVTVVKRPRQRVTATPERVALSATPAAQMHTCKILLRDADGQPVEIDKVTATDPALTCQWAAGEYPATVVRIRLAADYRGPSVEREARVTFKRPAGETVVVPVHIAAAGP